MLFWFDFIAKIFNFRTADTNKDRNHLTKSGLSIDVIRASVSMKVRNSELTTEPQISR